MIYASLGDADQAMNWLEKGYEDRFNPGVLLRPGFDPLRSDSRFQDLLHRIGLPRLRSGSDAALIQSLAHGAHRKRRLL